MIKKKVSIILGLYIGDDWDDAWKAADTQGKLTGTRTNAILLELCKAVEEFQNAKTVKSAKK